MIPPSDAEDGNQQERSDAVDPAAPRTVNSSTRVPESSSCADLEAENARLLAWIGQLKVDGHMVWSLMLRGDIIKPVAFADAEAEVTRLRAALQTAHDKAQTATDAAARYAEEVIRLSADLEKLEAKVKTAEQALEKATKEVDDWRATYRPKSSLVRELETAESELSALLAARDRLVEDMRAYKMAGFSSAHAWADELASWGSQG